MNVKQRIIDVGFKGLNRFHRTVLRLSGGHIGSAAFGMHVIELHTIGRKSGVIRTTMLTVPVIDGDRLVLVASKGGDDRNPDWFQNLVAHPDVELTLDGMRRAMRARPATAGESQELWPRVMAVYKPYAFYRRRAERDIPLVICEPR